MIGDYAMDFDPFSQLSLDPFPPGDGINPTAPAPSTPPPPVPKSDNAAMTGSGMNFPGAANADGQQYQQHHHQHQPMQVTPDQDALVHQQEWQQMPHPASSSNYRLDAFDRAPTLVNHQQQHVTLPPQTTNNFNMVVANSLTSPPISPLWTSASPNLSPMGAAANVANDFNSNAQHARTIGMMPTLTYAAPMSALGGAINPVQNPFNLFDVAPAPAPSAAPIATPAPADPFADSDALLPVQQQHQASGQQQDDADFWNDMGFGLPPPSINDNDGGRGNVRPRGNSDCSHSSESFEDDDGSPAYKRDHSLDEAPVALDGRGLPAGGGYYNARVTTPLLGAIFSSGYELSSTLLKTASDSFVEAIGDRPVISFIIDGSAADTAGIGLGHVLLNVNGDDVNNTDEAVRMISAAPRPMTMEFYIPNKEVRMVKTEAQCMVKYDDQSTEAPTSVAAWKPKYVVVGDMLGKPHILYMYRSKVGRVPLDTLQILA